MPPTETDGQSIELGNLNDPEDGTPTAAPVAGDENSTPPVSANAATSPDPTDNSGAIDVAANVAKPAAQTPMEQYRDLKLQQASRPNGVNPASVRRYLKVDRATLMDAANAQ